MMSIKSKALYLGNTNNEDCGFTVGKEYKIHDFGDGYVGVYDDNSYYCFIQNGAFHKFKLSDNYDYFVTNTECAVMPPNDDKKTHSRYYINGYAVSLEEFEAVMSVVANIYEGGGRCDEIKFEVKFEVKFE